MRPFVPGDPERIKDIIERILSLSDEKAHELPIDVEIGFAFLPEYWSLGYGVESAQAVMDFGRDELGIERIVAIANPDNERSFRLLKKIGLHYERLIQLPGQELRIRLFTPEGTPE